jgi:prepilin-type N-terminal cleavage/methylation domain-containing protein
MRLVSHQPAHPGASSDAGFGLLELIIVMAILAAAAALSFPRIMIGRVPPRTVVQSMALQLVAELQSVRAEALRTNAEQTFTIALGQRMTWSQIRPTPKKFIDGIDIEVTGPSLEWSGDRALLLRFQPTGVTLGGEIIVRDGRATAQSDAVRINVDWLTGVTRIERAR